MRTPFPRIVPALLAAFMLTASIVPAASAREIENPWSRWTTEVLDRPTKAEIPLALMASLPGMLIITPIWLGKLAYQRWTSDD